jgi:hypothetical protein
MSTGPLIALCVLAVLIVAALAAVLVLPHRLRHRKPLETHPDNLADPLPLSTVQRKR